MAIVRIDPTIIQQLVLQGLGNVVGVAMVAPGEAVPEDEAKWARLVSVDLAGEGRHLGDGEPHHDGLTVNVEVGVKVAEADPAGGGSAGALQSACSAVCAALADFYGADEQTRHYVQMQTMGTATGAAAAEQPAAGRAVLVGKGRAERVAGSSVKVLP